MIKKVWAILLSGRRPFSQPFQNQRSAVRREAACIPAIDNGYPGLVVYKRKVREKLGILSFRVSCEETSGTLLKLVWRSSSQYTFHQFSEPGSLIFYHPSVLYYGFL